MTASLKVGELHVEFTRKSGSNARRPVEAITIRSNEGLTPTDLRRFAWSQWFTAADALDRGLYKLENEGAGTPIDALEHVRRLKRRRPSHPGRRGYSETFYRQKNQEYEQLKLKGISNRLDHMAATYGVPVDTMHTWIKKGRKLETPSNEYRKRK